MALAAQIAAANAVAGGMSERCFSDFQSDGETIIFWVVAGDSSGFVSLALGYPSLYPQTGGVAYADGWDDLTTAVAAISDRTLHDASLVAFLRELSRKLDTAPAIAMAEQLGVYLDTFAAISDTVGHSADAGLRRMRWRTLKAAATTRRGLVESCSEWKKTRHTRTTLVRLTPHLPVSNPPLPLVSPSLTSPRAGGSSALIPSLRGRKQTSLKRKHALTHTRPPVSAGATPSAVSSGWTSSYTPYAVDVHGEVSLLG